MESIFCSKCGTSLVLPVGSENSQFIKCCNCDNTFNNPYFGTIHRIQKKSVSPEDSENDELRVKIVYITAILFFFLIAYLVITMNSNESSSSSDSSPDNNSNISTVQKVMNSPWNSSVYQVEKYLIHNLNDPDSYEAIEWSEVVKISDDEYRVRHKYRAKNEYGGYVVENQIFTLDAEGNVIDVWQPN